jgi:magnesium transporter
MDILAYLYDADGTDKEIKLESGILESLNDNQLLWINILKRDKQLVESAASFLQLKHVPVRSILNVSERPKIDRFNDFYRFFVVSVENNEKGEIFPIPIDYIVGKNFVITIHDGDVKYFQEFRAREKGETQLGSLDAESFVVTLLDLHIVSYFRVLERIEQFVDQMDDRILKRDLEDDAFLRDMVHLRSNVSRLRRWFLPHRDVFYALSRPDFKQAAETESFENFQLLNEHFETAVDAIESSRDQVLSLFDLYTSKTAHRMNNLMKRLTFITLMVGSMGVVAGIFGMNFEEAFFKSSAGFWLTIAGKKNGSRNN